MANIIANVTRMFESHEPWDCSNSQANLGPNAGQLTWAACTTIAADPSAWLVSSLADAVQGIREHAAEYGAWDEEEIANWSEEYCLAFLVQEVASDLRLIGSDDLELKACARKYQRTDWDKRSEYPRGHYFVRKGSVMVDYYTGI